MPKVVHIIHEGSGGGGMTLALNYFPRYQNDFETVAITGCAGSLPDRLRATGVKVHALPLDRPWSCVLSIPSIARVLRSEKPDLVIVHGQWGGFCGAVAAWLARVKRVIYYTHMPAFYTDWDLYRLLRDRFVEKVTCAIATRVVCPAAANRYQYLLRHLAPEEKIVHLPNGIDLHSIPCVTDKTALKQELKLSADGPIIISVGRLEDQKRVDWLINAWHLVENRVPSAHLYIVGDGSERQNLETLAQQLELKHCHFLGRQPEAYRYFLAANAGVITTMFEAQPYSLLEAMACACPMVGTASDGVVETIQQGETGYCVPVADPQALAERLVELISDNTLAEKMGGNARKYIDSHFSLEPIVARQIQLARQTLQNSDLFGI